jgi:serine/threonine protein kinase
MYNSKGKCVVIDLGMCLRIPLITNDATFTISPCKIPPQGICGKKNYIAPEVIEGTHFDPTRVDIWALGIILFIMLTGVPPIESATAVDQRYRMVCAGLLGNMLEQWHMPVSATAVDLISRILRPNPDDRLTLEQILGHPWMIENST